MENGISEASEEVPMGTHGALVRHVRAGYVRKPAGKNPGRAQQDFELQRDKIRHNDITDRYIAGFEEYLETFLRQMQATRDRSLTAVREEKLEALLAFAKKTDRKGRRRFRIFGFRAFIKHPEDDYFLGGTFLAWNEEKDLRLTRAEMFIALEVMAHIDNAVSPNTGKQLSDETRENLLRKWLLHEAICPIYGHKSAIKVLKRLYPDGNLRQVIRDVLDRRDSPSVVQKVRQRSFSFEPYTAQIAPQKTIADKVLNNSQVRERLGENWFYNIANDRRESGDLRVAPKRVVETRVTKVKVQLPSLLQAAGLADDDGNVTKPIRVFLSGSHFWTGEFIDDIEGNIEVDVMVDGSRAFENSIYLDNKIVKDIFGIRNLKKERAKVRIALFGTEELTKAAKGAVKNRDELRKKLVLLPHEAIQVFGDPVELRPHHSGGVQELHCRNLRNLADHYREEIGKGELKSQQLDWLRIRVKAIEGYLLEQVSGMQAQADAISRKRRRRGPSVGEKVAGLLRRLLGRGTSADHGPLLNRTLTVNDTDLLSPHLHRAEDDKLPPTAMPAADNEPETGQTTNAMATENAPRYMVTFYGVALQSGDALHGYEGSYRLIKKLGEGAQGAVWSGEQIDDAGKRVRDVALKIPSRHHEWDWNKEAEWRAIVNFNKEIRALSKLTWQPNVIRILDWYEQSTDVPFYVMEAISGTDLNDYFENRDSSEREVLSMFARIAKGLEAAHLEGLAHRDLKPENIMIRDSDGEPVVLDFGSASDVEYSQSLELTAVGAAKGTPVYMSPEMAARLLSDKPSFLVIERDSAFSSNGCTRRCRRDEIIGRIDRAEAGEEESGETLGVRNLGRCGRFRLWRARRRMRPVLEDLYSNGLIEQEPVIRGCRLIESEAITFGAFVHHGILYIEERFLEDRSFETILVGDPEQEFKQDIYMLGIMLYQRLTWPLDGEHGKIRGELPFPLPEDRSNLWGAVLSRLRAKYIPLRQWQTRDRKRYMPVSAGTDAMVARMLSLDPRERYDASELRDELTRLLESGDDAPAEERCGELRRLQQERRLRRSFAGLALSVITAAIACVAAGVFMPEIPDRLVEGAPASVSYALTITAGIALGLLALLAAVAMALGLLIMCRHRVGRWLMKERYVRARLQALEQD